MIVLHILDFIFVLSSNINKYNKEGILKLILLSRRILSLIFDECIESVGFEAKITCNS